MNTLGNAARDRAAACHHQGDQVLVINLFLTIRQLGESLVQIADFIATQVVAEFAILEGECMTSRVLTEHKALGWDSDRFRRHDFVAERITQYPMLVNAGFVRESVPSHDGLVGLYLEADDFAE